MTHYQLSTSSCPLPAIHYWLSTTRCPLPAIHHQLYNASYPQLIAAKKKVSVKHVIHQSHATLILAKLIYHLTFLSPLVLALWKLIYLSNALFDVLWRVANVVVEQIALTGPCTTPLPNKPTSCTCILGPCSFNCGTGLCVTCGNLALCLVGCGNLTLCLCVLFLLCFNFESRWGHGLAGCRVQYLPTGM